MRAIAIDAHEPGGLGSLLDEMHRLRARVFAGRLGWQVTIEEGQERNEYDALGPTYILALTHHGDVAGCARLLPTMLARTFPQLLAEGRLDGKPTMIESSRFCVDSQREGRGGRFLHEATLTMFAGIIEWSMSNGFDEIATATDVRFERILQRAGWPMTRLGVVQLIGETMSVAGIVPADQASLRAGLPTGLSLRPAPSSARRRVSDDGPSPWPNFVHIRGLSANFRTPSETKSARRSRIPRLSR